MSREEFEGSDRRSRPMNYRELIDDYGSAAEIDGHAERERSANGILLELAGCLTWGAAQHLADTLPEPTAGDIRSVATGTTMARYQPEAFISAIAARDGVDREEARRRAAALAQVLRRRLGDEMRQISEELDRFHGLLNP
ncbi:MAG: DUF2267 domain-containing protein [Candidatus Dormibacteraeota bacterium]|nr:DUF2267 domain-containing protein [Candidatus Dormibacteraeota bacterium]